MYRWSQIKRAKGANDVARAKQFSKLATQIIASIVAGKGETDPGLNLYIGSAIAQARAIQMPKSNVETAIKKGVAAAAGKGAVSAGDLVVYEGMSSQGIACVVEALSTNRNKTFAEVRHCFTKNDGALKSIMFQFEKRSRIVFGNSKEAGIQKSMDDLLNVAMELDGVDDIGEEVDDAETGPTIELFTTLPNLLKIQKQIVEQGLEVTEMDLAAYIPTSRVEDLTESQLNGFERLLDDLENQADVTKVWHNAWGGMEVSSYDNQSDVDRDSQTSVIPVTRPNEKQEGWILATDFVSGSPANSFPHPELHDHTVANAQREHQRDSLSSGSSFIPGFSDSDHPDENSAPVRLSITSDRLPPITNRVSVTTQKPVESLMLQPVIPVTAPPATASVMPLQTQQPQPPHQQNQYEQNIATHLPSSNRTSRYIYQTQQIQQQHQKPIPPQQPPTHHHHHHHQHQQQPIQHDQSETSSQTSGTNTLQSITSSTTSSTTRSKNHRRVASARTSREQDYQQAKGAASRKNATLNTVKKQLNFGTFLIPSEIEAGNSATTSQPVFDEKEMRRVMAVHGMRLWNGPKEPRFDSITSLTSRLLNAEVCTITIVDSSLVRYWSINDSSNGKYFSYSATQEPSLVQEARCDSFCQYTIREGGGGSGHTGNNVRGGGSSSNVVGEGKEGFVVLDASREPKFKSRPLVQSGLHFYAGAPLITKSGVKIGALSIRGPARTQFTSQEAKILRQMTEWAIDEFDLYVAKRELDFREALRLAKDQMSEIKETVCSSGGRWTSGRGVLKTCLDVIKNALKLKNVMILKIKKNPEGTRSIRSTVFALAEKCDIKPGDEKFTELCQATLDKPGPSPYILDRSHSIASQLQVCRYIGEHVRQSASELIWSHGRPVGVIALFFEGTYKTVSPLEEQFLISSAIIISTIWQQMETHDSLSKSMNPSAHSQLLVNRLKQASVTAAATSAAAAKALQQQLHHLQQQQKTGTGTTAASTLSLHKSHSSFSSSQNLPKSTTDPQRSKFSIASQSILTLHQSQNSINKLLLSSQPNLSLLFQQQQQSLPTTTAQPQVPPGLQICILICEPILPAVKGNLVSEATAKAALLQHAAFHATTLSSSSGSNLCISGSNMYLSSLANGTTGGGNGGGGALGSSGGGDSLLGVGGVLGNGLRHSFGSSRSLKSKSTESIIIKESSRSSARGMRTSSSHGAHRRFKSTASSVKENDNGIRRPRVGSAIDEGIGIWGGTSAKISLTPKGAIDLLADFTQMMEVVGEQQGIKYVKKCGSLFGELVEEGVFVWTTD
ncbi:UNVERIFIED_CONTAM: hypothetical protein HDU68_002432 [Siphonaria sp. JEL0065]|nr:hypothetical protein HDU68_002432 [Siphonaria sp. JEL0065]